MDRKYYYLGLFGKIALIWNESEKIYYTPIDDGEIMLICDENEKIMKVREKKGKDGQYMEFDENMIRHGVIKQIDEDGSRWEGDWLNEKPFGFGSLFDGEGNRIYSGFMFDGKKIGFGTEYFADNHQVDYCGNFMNDKRHGWGTTYDRNGQKLYEGDWRCGKNCDFEDKIVIKDNCEEDCLRIHDLIKELEIGENCWNKWKGDLIIQNFPNLQLIIVKRNSLKNLNSLKICNCEKLKTIKNEDGTFSNVKNVIIEST